MSKKHFGLAGFALVIALSSQAFAQKLRVPFRDVGACPFECCTYREWTANKATVLLKSMTDNAPIYYRIRKGEKVEGVTGTVITTKPGISQATRNTSFEYYNAKSSNARNIPVKKGERLSVLTYLGEGIYKVWYKGKIYETSLDEPEFKTISRPVSVWWVKIKNRKGQIGWTNLNGNFDNIDSCG